MDTKIYDRMFRLEAHHWWYKGLHHLVLEWFKSKQFSPETRVLDAGCGSGQIAALLQPHAQITVVDFHKRALEYARERGIKNIIEADLNHWKPQAGTFDVVLCLDVLYHAAIQQEQVLKSLYDSLVPGGYLLIQLPAYEVLRRQHDEATHGARRYTRASLTQLLSHTGYAVECSSYRYVLLYFVIRLMKWLPNKTGSSDLTGQHALVNYLLTRMVKLENFVLLAGIRLWPGSSVWAVARKPT